MLLTVVLLRRSRLAMAAMSLIVCLSALPTYAQDATEEQAQPLELDLQRMLFAADVDHHDDPVWDLQPEAGRRIIMLPFVLHAQEREIELTRPTINPRGGRFIAFVIPEDKPDHNTNDNAIDFAIFADTSEGALDRLLFSQAQEQNISDYEPVYQPDQPFDEQDPDTEQASAIDAKAPRLARRIILHPDGKVQWGLDRGMPSATLKPGGKDNLYPLKLDPQMLRDLEPPRPERITRQDGESSRDYALRKREQQLAQREQTNEFRELRDALRDLPDQFTMQSPAVIYAAVEIRDDDEISLQGPSPLPWSLSTADREMLNQVAQGGGAQGEEQKKAMTRLSAMVDSRHPMDARVVAFAALRGGIAEQMQPNGDAFRLLSKLVASKDPVARNAALYAVTHAEQQTRQSARVLEIAGQSAEGEDQKVMKLASLRTLFILEAANPENTGFIVTQINQAFSDPNGPEAWRVIDELLAALARVSQQGAGEEMGRIRSILASRLELDAIPADQGNDLIAAIIRHAPNSALAASWLDEKLLRSPDAARVNATLNALSRAKAPSTLTPAIEQAYRALIFTVPGLSSAGAAADESTLQMTGSIALTSNEHGLIKALGSTDAAQSALAWQALSHFRVGGNGYDAIDSADPEASLKTFEAIVEKGLDQDKTPAALVDFLDNHSESALRQAAGKALIKLLIDPGVDPAVATPAARRVLDARWGDSINLTDMTPDQQQKLVTALYERTGAQPPTSAGLVADQSTGMMDWFLQQIAQDGLPTAREWAQQAVGAEFGSPQQVFEWAASADPVVASAAASALVLSAGGSEADQQRFAQDVVAMNPRTAESVEQAWAKVRTQLYARALTSAQGTYKLAVTLHSFDQPTSTPQRIELGVVELKADGTNVSLSVEAVGVAVAQDRLAIQLKSLSSLRTFSNPDLAALPLSQLTEPLDLLPQESGAWSGRTQLPDGREIEVALEPAK